MRAATLSSSSKFTGLIAPTEDWRTWRAAGGFPAAEVTTVVADDVVNAAGGSSDAVRGGELVTEFRRRWPPPTVPFPLASISDPAALLRRECPACCGLPGEAATVPPFFPVAFAVLVAFVAFVSSVSEDRYPETAERWIERSSSVSPVDESATLRDRAWCALTGAVESLPFAADESRAPPADWVAPRLLLARATGAGITMIW